MSASSATCLQAVVLLVCSLLLVAGRIGFIELGWLPYDIVVVVAAFLLLGIMCEVQGE